MEYFNLLEFNKEPFSNSPEPEFLFESSQHSICLQRLELAVRLRRGLNIVIGDVGTGKTTLCRKLLQNLAVPAADAPDIETFLLLDPVTEGRTGFLSIVAEVLGIKDVHPDEQEWHLKEKIKNFLFEKGIQENKNIVLIIDEGQKIAEDCLEILREFLNYETNSYKLLQIVIFAQPEFRTHLDARPNLLDRVNYLYALKPLTLRQTKAMIEHRIALASLDPGRKSLFTIGGIWAIYFATAGYPRQIVSLCHQVLLLMIIRGDRKAGWFLVRSCLKTSERQKSFKKTAWAAWGIIILAMVTVVGFLYGNHWEKNISNTKLSAVSSGIDLKNVIVPTETSIKPLPKPEVRQETMQKENVRQDMVKPVPPEILGEIEIKQKMTIWRILENIYGDTGYRTKQAFISANPQIKNIDNTEVGMSVRVPIIAEAIRPVKPDTILVCLESGNKLQEIYYSYIQKRDLDGMPSLLFLSVWNKREGLHYAIVLDRRFTDVEQAGIVLKLLPASLAASPRIVSQWDGDTITFNGRFAL